LLTVAVVVAIAGNFTESSALNIVAILSSSPGCARSPRPWRDQPAACEVQDEGPLGALAAAPDDPGGGAGAARFP
jgi:hypothetical protein